VAAGDRPRAARTDPSIRRSLILDAARDACAEATPLHVTVDQVARRAGVSRALVHRHFADRADLLDALARRTIARLDAWVGHGLGRAGDPAARLRAITYGVLSFVAAEPDAWQVLGAAGGLDHPDLHVLLDRWATAVDAGDRAACRYALGGLAVAAARWGHDGLDPDEACALVQRAAGLRTGPG